VVLLEVELAVRLEHLVAVELGRRREAGGLRDLVTRDRDAAAAELLADQGLDDDLVPRRVLELADVGGGDGLGGRRLALVVEALVDRRPLLIGDGLTVDPTELAADLRAARDVVASFSGGSGRVIAVFQPHLYSRTRFFADEFGAALGLADEAIVLDVYGAREDPEPGVSGALVARRVQLPPERVAYAPDRAAVPALVAERARPGDIVLTMGAGDVTELGPRIVAELGGAADGSGG